MAKAVKRESHASGSNPSGENSIQDVHSRGVYAWPTVRRGWALSTADRVKISERGRG